MYGSDAHIEGSAGIVITAAGEHWRSMGVHCFRISDGALIASLSVFPLELLASVVAITIAACLHCYCEVFTDCQSAQTILSQPKMLRAFSANENLILLQIGLTNGFVIKTSWIEIIPRSLCRTAITGKSTCGELQSRRRSCR